MKLISKIQDKDTLVLISQSEEEAKTILEIPEGLVFATKASSNGSYLLFRCKGLVDDYVLKPINISYVSENSKLSLLSNLAHTPFSLQGRNYESVEGFWQSIKYRDAKVRDKISKLYGFEAKSYGKKIKYKYIIYHGEKIRM